MKRSIISFLFLGMFAVLLSGVANGQSIVEENAASEEVIEPSEKAFANLVVIPNSRDYGDWYCTHSVTYGFQIKNNGGTTESGSVFVYGGIPFSCVSGCSFSLNPGQSQYAYIKFEPFYEGSANGTLIAGVGATASLSGEGLELEDTDDPDYPLCEEYP